MHLKCSKPTPVPKFSVFSAARQSRHANQRVSPDRGIEEGLMAQVQREPGLFHGFFRLSERRFWIRDAITGLDEVRNPDLFLGTVRHQ
jgi:hypothetical protein